MPTWYPPILRVLNPFFASTALVSSVTCPLFFGPFRGSLICFGAVGDVLELFAATAWELVTGGSRTICPCPARGYSAMNGSWGLGVHQKRIFMVENWAVRDFWLHFAIMTHSGLDFEMTLFIFSVFESRTETLEMSYTKAKNRFRTLKIGGYHV